MQLSSNARKGLAAGLAASTVLMSAMTGILPTAFAAPHAEGCNILYNGTVYYVLGGQRRGFPSPEVFFSWGNGFGGVQAANAEDVAMPVGPVMVYADGTLVKGPNDPLVYLVANGQKRGFTTGSVFTGLGFKFSNIQSAPANTFADLPTGANLDSATERHTAGVWVLDSTGTVWRMTATGRVGLPSMEVFNSWGKSWSTVVPANAADMAAPVEGVAQAKPSCSAGTPPPSGSMSVSLNGPASSTLVATSVANPVADFNFSGNGTVTAVTLERIGVSANGTLSSVYLFDGATRLTDAGSFGSDNKVSFSAASLFSVSGSKTLSVKADVLTGTAGQTVGVKLISYTVGGVANPVSVSGNIHSIASATLATAKITDAASSPAANANLDPATDVTVWQDTITVAVRDINFTRVMFRKVGTINNSDLVNFKLYVDGVQVATSYSLNADGYVSLVPASPVKLTVGARTFRLTADVIGGSSRTFTMSIRSAADIGLVDTSFNAGVGMTRTSDTTLPVASMTAGTQTVSSGTLTTVKASGSPSGNVTKDATDQVLGRWTITANGEAVKIETLNFTLTAGSGAYAGESMRNFRILVNGSQVGSTITLPITTSTQITTNFTVTPGSPVTVEARGDIVSAGATPVANGNKIVITMKQGSGNATAQVSLAAVNAPDADKAANELTIAVGGMTGSKMANYTDQTTTVPQTNYKLAAYNLTGNSTEDVNVTNIHLDLTFNGGSFVASKLTNVYVKYGSSTTSTRAGATSLDYPVSFTLFKNSVVPIEVYANIGTPITAGATHWVTTDAVITGTSAASSTAATTGTVTGQKVTVGAGSLASALAGSTPVSAILYSNQSVDVAGIDMVSTNDSFTITEIVVKTNSAALPTALTQISLKDGGTTVQSKPAAASVTFTGLSIPVSANLTKTLTIAVTLGNVGTGSGATGESIGFSLDSFKALDSQGSEVTDGTDRVGNNMYAYKAVPQIDPVSLPTTALNDGQQTLAKISVQGMGGTIGWKKMQFSITKTLANVTITSPIVWDVTANQAVAGAGSLVSTGAGTTNCLAAEDTACTAVFVATTEQQVSSARVYELRADVAGSTTSTSVSTRLAQPSAYAASAAYATVAAANSGAATFVWTDRSLNGHGEGSLDWTNDFAIKNLPTSLQALTR